MVLQEILSNGAGKSQKQDTVLEASWDITFAWWLPTAHIAIDR
jgi:hypothetical protein